MQHSEQSWLKIPTKNSSNACRRAIRPRSTCCSARYQAKILNLVISRYVRDSEEVQDVAQEAFIKAYRALPRFRGDSAFYTWLYRIAINTAKNHLVARSRRPPAMDVDVEDADYRDDARDVA